MFRDLKEYQELQKLYEEKVSKTDDENLSLQEQPSKRKEELIQRLKDKKEKNKKSENPEITNFKRQVKDIKTRAKYGSTATIETQDGKTYKPGDEGYKEQLKKAQDTVKKSGAITPLNKDKKSDTKPDTKKVDTKPETKVDTKPKPKPETVTRDASDAKKEQDIGGLDKKKIQQIEADVAKKKADKAAADKAAADKKEVEFRLKNTESSEQSAKVEAKPKRRPVPSPSEAGMGPGAARARAMAKARIAAKKANPNQKQLSGKEKAQAMAKARIAAKNQASQAKPPVNPTQVKPFPKPQPKVKSPMDMRGESYDAYDMVLEYLLSTEQVATIEEANYVMVEMDAETIQDIVAEGIGQLKILPTLVKGAAAVYGVKKGAEFLGRKKGESDIKKTQPKFQNPSDGSIPGRQSGESLKDYKKRRYDGIQKQMDKM